MSPYLMSAICWFLALLFPALLMGTSFAHVLEMRAKLAMPAALWLTMQHGVYAEFATIGAVVELGSIVLTGLLAFLVRNNERLFCTPRWPRH